VVSDILENITLNQDVTVEPSFVQRCIHALSKSKAEGVDGVINEHLIAASWVIYSRSYIHLDGTSWTCS